MPATVRFATKPELAARMLWRALDAGMKVDWVLGDSVYGSHRPLRNGLEQRCQAYALAVACQEPVQVGETRTRVDRVARTRAPSDWQRLSAGQGSKGPRLFEWAQVELADTPQADFKQTIFW